jgi:transcriptional regulator of acetoin/glycerol metabolism
MNSDVQERELAAACDDDSLPPDRLPARTARFEDPVLLPATWDEFKKLKRQIRDVAVQQVERQFLADALQRCGGNVSRAANQIGIQRTNLHALMRKHGLTSGARDLEEVA